MDDPDSVRSFYKKLIALRKDPVYKETVVYGSLEPVWEERHNLMAYYRKGDKMLLVIGNYQTDAQEIALPAACGSSGRRTGRSTRASICLRLWITMM